MNLSRDIKADFENLHLPPSQRELPCTILDVFLPVLLKIRRNQHYKPARAMNQRETFFHGSKDTLTNITQAENIG